MVDTVKHPTIRALILAVLTLPALTLAQNEESAPQADTAWLDESHRYITTQTGELARWMNDFFGDVRAEEEAPRSTVRLRYEQEVDEHNNWVSDLKLRGKVHLPNFNKRLSLLFADEDSGTTGHDDLLIDSRDTPEDLAVQYNAREREKDRIDFRIGLRSSLHPKTSVRYKYEEPLSRSLLGTFSQEALYLGGDGFASITRLELDKSIGEDKIIQWHNRMDWEENTSGITWGSSLSWDKRLTDKKAFGYFYAVSGATAPDNRVTGHALGVRYRQNIYRDWLFMEVQPSYRWDQPDSELPRTHGAVILFRLEAVFTSDSLPLPQSPKAPKAEDGE